MKKSFNNFFQHMVPRIKAVRWGHLIWLIGFIPVATFTIGMELFYEVHNFDEYCTNGNFSETSGNVINYLATIFAHCIICILIFFQTILKNYEHISLEKENLLKFHSLLAVVCLFLILYLSVNFFDLNIEQLSHQVVYPLFFNIPELKPLFNVVIFSNTIFSFYLFSIIPFGATLIGLAGVAVSCFEIAIHTDRISKINSYEDWQMKLNIIFSDIKICLIKVIVGLATSSTATSLYFLLPIDYQNNNYHYYFSFAKSMSIFWGIVFTLTITSLFILPYSVYKKKILHLRQGLAASNPESFHSLEIDSKGYLLIKDNFSFLVTVFVPIIASIIVPLLS